MFPCSVIFVSEKCHVELDDMIEQIIVQVSSKQKALREVNKEVIKSKFIQVKIT